MQPMNPVQSSNPALDFTNNNPQSQPQVTPQPVMPPQPDPAISQLQNDIGELKTALAAALTPPEPAPATTPAAGEPAKTYDQWGDVFEDVDKRAAAIVDQKIAEREQLASETQQQLYQQEEQNSQYIDTSLNQLRQAGYMPPVTNQFDNNDPGKQAENELLGYALSIGSTDLIGAAKELKFRHDAGFVYDYQNQQFTQVNRPNPGDPNAAMFGNIPQNPDQPAFPAPVAPLAPAYPQSPVGLQNPYMPPRQQYPAGFNAPVSSGNSYQGVQGQVPSLGLLRNNSYDSLVENFNRAN